MAVTYLSHGAPVALDRLCPEESVLVVDPRIEAGVRPLGDHLRGSATETRSDLIVVRGSSPDFGELLEEDPIISDVVRGTPVFGLAGSHDRHEPTPRLWQPSWSETTTPPSLADLREAEILGMLDRSGAIQRLEHFHYILPSRYHAQEFIRLADALHDPIDIVRIVDWLLPQLRHRGAVVADTGTLLPLLFAIRLEAFRRFGLEIEIATLSEYPTDYTAMEELLSGLRAQGAEHLLLLVSVSSSGQLASLFERLSGGSHDVVVICETGESGLPALAKRSVERWEAGPDGDCSRCQALHQLFIDPRTYQVLPLEGLKLMPFDRDVAKENESFWRLVDEVGAVQLHFDEIVPAGPRRGRRHLAINIAVDSLLKDADFRHKVLDELVRGGHPDHVLIPDHGAAGALTAVAAEAFPDLDPSHIHRISGTALEPELVEVLAAGKHLLIFDDALITGNTLIFMRRALRNALRHEGHAPRVDAFVVLNRPRSVDDEKAVRRNFGAPQAGSSAVEQRFRYVEAVVLPDRCPWCEERETLTRLARRMAESGAAEGEEVIRDRINRLESTKGLEPPLLPSRDDLPGDVTHDSFIGELEPAAAFAATASVAQWMRLDLERERQGAQIAVVNLGLVVEAFYDPIIVAGLLRVVPQRFLRHLAQDARVNRELLEHGPSFGTSCLLEIAWAAILDRLPREGIHAVLSEIDDGGSPILRAYRELLEVQDPGLRSGDSDAGGGEDDPQSTSTPV